jgi:hypothetical protein
MINKMTDMTNADKGTSTLGQNYIDPIFSVIPHHSFSFYAGLNCPFKG